MISVNNFTLAYAKAILAATKGGHALRHIGLVEERTGVVLAVSDEIGEILDLAGQGKIDGSLLELADIAHSLEHLMNLYWP